MADPSRSPKPPSAPRWVKVSAIVAAVVILLVVVVLLAGGDHGPSRHQPEGGNPGAHTPPVQHNP
jgi:hypothetical protein